MGRRALERRIDVLIGLLDAMDGDPDFEDDDPLEDGDTSEEDDAAEDDFEDMCIAGDDGCGPVWRNGHLHYGHDDERFETILAPVYGLDQTEPMDTRGAFEPAPDMPCAPITWAPGKSQMRL